MQRALRIGLVIVLFLVLACLFVYHWAQRALIDAGVEQLDWQGLSYSSGEFHLERVSGVYNGADGRLEFSFEEVRLAPTWKGGPRVLLLDVRDLDLDWDARPERTASDKPPGNQPVDDFLHEPQDWFDASRSLPDVIRVHALQLDLPCQATRCRLVGGLEVRNHLADQQLEARAQLSSGSDRLELEAGVSRNGEALALSTNLRLNDQPGAALLAHWSHGAGGAELSGELTVPSLPASEVLVGLVRPWADVGALPVELPSGLSLQARWALQPPGAPRSWQDWLAGEVRLDAQADLTRPWQVADVGDVSGSMSLSLAGDRGRWLLNQGSADVRLEQPAIAVLNSLPEQARPQVLHMNIRPSPALALGWQEELVLALEARAEGGLKGTVAGLVHLTPGQAWQARLDDGRIDLQVARLDQQGMRLQNVRAQLPLQARMDAEAVHLLLGQGAFLSAGLASHAELGLALSDVRLGLPGMTVEAPLNDPAATSIAGQTLIAASQVQHAALRPQGWTLQGALRQGNDGLSWSGTVATVGGLGLDVALVWPLDQPWRAEVQLQEVFFRADNPIAATLADWPELLTLASGRLRGRFDVSGVTSLERLDGTVDASGIAGIYDRATFEGLTLPLDIAIARDVLSVQTDGLRLTTLNPGVELGPLSARFGYDAPLNAPIEGRFTVHQAQMGLLGGELVVQPATLDLAAERQHLVIDLRGLQLASLFEAYPADGLSGRGTLDGQLPVSLVDGQVTVDSGSVRAREPGGVLQYRSERLSELGRSNLGMRELAVALDDFRYSVLSSELDYGEDGMLILGLRLEGNNPDLQNGRPVHLNINLEENIPALLASLQLSGQVSDIIQKRVQERLLRQRLVQ
ncbi:YdbH domain-containing protein [Halopseudomonas nanhaiensis]|uniref:intermembrane phospholipid transport protein YdbH family protein n=1 Tax=Halopseudomonas nanhaiensis TaxID=2830842 RepID=UPI001CBFAD6E|nr:YdbH domain-containing protein [Halopseudomonas nanhaiensis]UAW98553.1 YdbH domain-containing protein [Halopseudomonas nanhaiensis]